MTTANGVAEALRELEEVFGGNAGDVEVTNALLLILASQLGGIYERLDPTR